MPNLTDLALSAMKRKVKPTFRKKKLLLEEDGTDAGIPMIPKTKKVFKKKKRV